MLLNLGAKGWSEGLTLEDYNSHSERNDETVKEMLKVVSSCTYSPVVSITYLPIRVRFRVLTMRALYLAGETLQNVGRRRGQNDT